MNAENMEAKDNLISELKIEKENLSDQVDKLQDSLKSKDKEIGSKNVEIESLKTEAKERSKNFVIIKRLDFAKLYEENKNFSDALRKAKEALERRDKEIENLKDQIDNIQGTLETKIKEKAKANVKDEVGELDKKYKVLFDLCTEMKKKYTEVKKSSEIEVKELKEAVDDLHVKESAKNEFMEEFKKEKNREVDLHLKKIIKLKEKLRKVEDLKSRIEVPNKAMITMVKNDDKPEASGSKDEKGNELVDHEYSSNDVELSKTDASETITADLDLEIKEGSEFVIKETKKDQELFGNVSDKRIKDLKAELRKSQEKNSALQDDKIELFEKIAQEKQKNDALEEEKNQKNDALEEIISQKEKNVQIVIKENTKVVRENRKLEEMLKLRKEEIELMKDSKN